MKDIPAIVQSHMAKRIALYGQEPEQPLVEELFQRYSKLQVRWSAISVRKRNGWHSSLGFMPGCCLPGK